MEFEELVGGGDDKEAVFGGEQIARAGGRRMNATVCESFCRCMRGGRRRAEGEDEGSRGDFGDDACRGVAAPVLGIDECLAARRLFVLRTRGRGVRGGMIIGGGGYRIRV